MSTAVSLQEVPLWIDGKARQGRQHETRRCDQRGHGSGRPAGAVCQRDGCRPRRAGGEAGVRGMAGLHAAQTRPYPDALPRVARARSARRSAHSSAKSTARSSSTRWDRCSAASRWSNSRLARRTCSKANTPRWSAATSTRIRACSRSASAPASRPSISRRWFRSGCFPFAHRVRQHVRAEAVGEGSLGERERWRSCSPKPDCPTASSTSCTATRTRWTRSSRIPTSRPCRSSVRRRSPSYIYTTAAAAGKRVQALGGAKNHAVVLPDADFDFTADALAGAAYGSAGERCMAISVAVAVGAPATRWSRSWPRRRAGSRSVRARRRGWTWARW